MLDLERMPEAEVSIRLGLYLIQQRLVISDVCIAIDGAQIQTKKKVHFPIDIFLKQNNCSKADLDRWQGKYNVKGYNYSLEIHSTPGQGDVVAKLQNGINLRIESKKGALIQMQGSKEYPLLREALGQLLTIEEYYSSDRLAVAVPNSKKFKELAQRWVKYPLIKKLELGFLLVDRAGAVEDIGGVLL